ncbi:MAG: hypothetical protein ACRD9S_14905 [Pyrinomonadaceae bacterium]
MQIINNNPLDLAGDDQEEITVKAVSAKPGDTVAFALDGVKGGILPNPFTFKLNKAAHDPSVLTLVFTFVGQGGAFQTTVTGSNGGPPSVFNRKQFGVAFGSISYTIDVL